jgi:hypothetical protein
MPPLTGEKPTPYARTPERLRIIFHLDEAARLLRERAEMHRAARSEARTHRALNRAQLAFSLRELLEYDWHDDDRDAEANAPAAL